MDNSKELPKSALDAAKHSVLGLCKTSPTLAFAISHHDGSELNILLIKYLNLMTRMYPQYEVYLYVQNKNNPPPVNCNFPTFNFDDIINHPESPIIACDFYTWFSIKDYSKKIYFYVYDPILLSMTDQKYLSILIQHQTPLITRNKEERNFLQERKFANVVAQTCDLSELPEMIKIIGENKWL